MSSSYSPSQLTMKTNLLPSSPSSSSSIVMTSLFSQQNPLYSSNLKLNFKPPSLTKLRVKCSSSKRPPPGPGSGETDSKGVLDAFFLGKALAEVINEGIEYTVGELLGAVGMLQAEQQRQVKDFQEQILKRAKRAKEKAAREALEAQGLVSKSTTKKVSRTSDDASPAVSHSPDTVATPDTSASSSDPDTTTINNDTTKD